MPKHRVFMLAFLLSGIVVSSLGARAKKALEITNPISVGAQVTYTLLDAGHWGFWANYEGLVAHDPYTGSGGGYFPKGKVPVLYTDGVLWGAYLRDPDTGIALSDTPRVGGMLYRIGTSPGWINSDGSPADVNDQRVRLYRIRSDWRYLTEDQLRSDAAYFFNISPDLVNDQMLKAIQDQYKTDWKEWPVDLGAPYVDVNGNGIYDPVPDSLGCPDETKGDYPGLADANQVIWMAVNDLVEAKVLNLSGSLPIGLEVHFTLWTYKGTYNPLGDVVFKRIEIFNKSGYQLDSMFISIISDPDLGDYSDDLVGCDSTKNIGFAYNSTDKDMEFLKFGLKPAAVVYDLLQGPIVKSDNSQDTAVFNLQRVYGYKNLPMTSFGYFSAGGALGDPPLGVIDFTLQWYNRMNGFAGTNDLRNPLPQIFYSGPKKGQVTKFPLSGNPVTDPHAQLGDIDGQGENLPPGDRRMYLNSGPFTMQPGDKQEVIVAIIGGLGKDHLNSLQEAWKTDDLVKLLYRQLFTSMPKPPRPPFVKATPLDDKIVLNWGFDQQRIKETENEKHGAYSFEGYTVYQLPSAKSKLTDDGVKRLATFDRIDGVKDIYGWMYSPRFHHPIYAPLQYGTDSGIRHFFVVNWDSINNRPFYRGSTYYFAVTAYNYNPYSEKYPSIESSPQILAVTVQDPKPGERYTAQPGQKVTVKGEQNGDVKCWVKVVDPAELTGDDYEIFFTVDRDSTSETFGAYVWNLKDVSKNRVVLTGQDVPLITNPAELENFGAPVADGMEIIVYQTHAAGIKAIVEVANGNGPLDASDWDGAGYPYQGNNVWHSASAPTDPNRFYISAGGGSGSLERIERSIANAHGHDFELRFTEAGGIYCWWYEGDTVANVPFEMWDVGIGTYDDTSDDVRCLTGGYSGGATVGAFDFGYTDPAFGFPATDWIDARVPLDSKGSWQAYYNDVMSGAWTYEWWQHSREVLSQIIICDFGGARTLPQTGTVIRFITTKGPTENTKFYFTAPGRISDDLELARKDVEKVNVFPNPFYGGIQRGPNGPVQGVTFNHLPRHAVIRIFTLGGVQVCRLEKNDDSQFLRWNLRNKNGLPVASGLYIIYIDMPELKKTKKLKLMVIMGE